MGAGHLVDGDEGGGPVGVAVDGDQGHVGGDVGQRLAGGEGGGDDDDARHLVVAEAVHGVEDVRAVQRPDPADPHGEPGGVGGEFQRGEQRGRAVEGAVLRDHADDLRPAGGQRSGGAVGAVAEFVDGGADAEPGLLADVGVSVEDTGDGLVGDAGESGHVGHRGVPRRSSAHGRVVHWQPRLRSERHVIMLAPRGRFRPWPGGLTPGARTGGGGAARPGWGRAALGCGLASVHVSRVGGVEVAGRCPSSRRAGSGVVAITSVRARCRMTRSTAARSSPPGWPLDHRTSHSVTSSSPTLC